MLSLLGLDPASYTPGRLHHPDRTFRETNCYIDLWIELLHARNIAPESVMACACGVDFEGDQWTFFKPSPEDLLRLHGIDVHEMQLYRPIVNHVTGQLQAGKTMTVEVDSFYLPDTEGAAYRKAHVKSSIAIEGIGTEGERLRYFHGAGYYELHGEDYRGIFRLGRTFSEDVLPPYVELIDFHSGAQLRDEALRRGAMVSLQRVVSRRNRNNPWLAFGERLVRDLPKLLEGSESDYHAYAFATVRQCGAAFEIAKSFIEWLAPSSAAGTMAAAALDRQVTGAKTLLFKLARRKGFDPRPAIEQLAVEWTTAMSAFEPPHCQRGRPGSMSGSSSAFATSALATSGADVAVRIPLKFGRESPPAADEAIFRCDFTADPVEDGEEVVLEMGGIATLSEVYLNGRKILESCSMFDPHRIDVSAILKTRNELEIVCRSLSAAIKARRGQTPHARWRTRVVSEPQLRWFRTTLLGRAPGFACENAPVGPWRPVTLVRHRRVVIDRSTRTTQIDATTGTGIVRASLQIRALESSDRPARGWLRSGEHSASLTFDESGAHATLSIPNVRRWWPHTHGEPELYPLQTELEFADGSRAAFDDVPVGFRPVEFNAGVSVNGLAIFCRGVVWTPTDESAMRERLTLLRDAGFNMIRIAGTTFYESESFHRLCDELGLLVWQDMMFANMDYPFADAGFHKLVTAEAERELSRLSKHSSTAVICGNSEIEQQAGMLGLDPMLGRGDFFGKELPAIVAQHCPGVPYIPSAPSGGDQPFRTRTGVANYFGVGAYLRPLDDARRAGVRFASECLAFSNVPESERIPHGVTPGHPAWKHGIPRDGGASWDFEDVRDHYLKTLYPVDPATLRYADLPRYLELSRVVTGEVMAEVFGEWRRPGSLGGGGIILWSADLEPGAGWGILDSTGYPKAAYWFLKRALAPQAVWMTGEGLNGVDIHAANDRAGSFHARLRVALYDRSRKVHEAERAIAIPEHGKTTWGVEEILGHFVDASYAYRFGAPGHDLIVASLYVNAGTVPLAQAFHFPAGRSVQRVPIEELGIGTQARRMADGSLELTLCSERFASGVRIAAANALPDDSYFHLEPRIPHPVSLRATGAASLTNLFITAINANGRLPVATESLS